MEIPESWNVFLTGGSGTLGVADVRLLNFHMLAFAAAPEIYIDKVIDQTFTEVTTTEKEPIELYVQLAQTSSHKGGFLLHDQDG